MTTPHELFAPPLTFMGAPHRIEVTGAAAIADPDARQTVGGRKYMLFYEGEHLHMVAWKERGTLYWVLNTLDNELPNDVMMGIATSCKPVK